MDLRLLSYFVAIADAGSLSAATQRLHVSQPALSASLKALEADLDVKLFCRRPRGMELTREGQIMLPYARDVLSAMERAKRALSSNKPSRTSVTLGVTPSLGLIFLPTLLTNVATEGDLELIAHQGPAIHLFRSLGEGRSDAAVTYADSKNHEGEAVSLLSEDFVLVGSSNTLGGVNQVVQFAELADIKLVLEPTSHFVRRRIDSVAAASGVTLKIAAEVEPLNAKLSLLRNADFCTIVPRWVFDAEIAAGALRVCAIENPNLLFTLKLFFRRNLPVDQIRQIRTLIEDTVRSLAIHHQHWRLTLQTI